MNLIMCMNDFFGENGDMENIVNVTLFSYPSYLEYHALPNYPIVYSKFV